MRRVVAITLLTALTLSLSLPVWAASCEKMGKVSVCHRTAAHQHHHCDSMMEDQDEATIPSSEVAVNDLSTSCPMRCCMQARVAASSAVPAASFLPALISSENHTYFYDVIFLSNGFSSHTDRGPPAA